MFKIRWSGGLVNPSFDHTPEKFFWTFFLLFFFLDDETSGPTEFEEEKILNYQTAFIKPSLPLKPFKTYFNQPFKKP